MTARSRFCQLALAQLGKPVLWAAKGPDAFDCSGLVTCSLLSTGGKDLRHLDNAQKLHDETPNLATFPAPTEPLAGDLVFYGHDAAHIEHVAIWMVGGKALSADGATPRIATLEEALRNPANRVRLHDSVGFRRDLPGNPVSIHRISFLDALDGVCR